MFAPTTPIANHSFKFLSLKLDAQSKTDGDDIFSSRCILPAVTADSGEDCERWLEHQRRQCHLLPQAAGAAVADAGFQVKERTNGEIGASAEARRLMEIHSWESADMAHERSKKHTLV